MTRLVVVAVALAAGAGCGGSGSDVDGMGAQEQERKLEAVAFSVSRPLARLSDALDSAHVSDRASLSELRARAEQASRAFGRAARKVRHLEDEAAGTEPEKARELGSALDAYRSLADALSRRSLSAERIEVAAERARLAALAAPVRLRALATTHLVAALMKAGGRAIDQSRRGNQTGPGDPPFRGGVPVAVFTNYTGPAFRAKLPSGGGWAAPSHSEPTPGRVFRTTVRGPGKLFLLIDFTPSQRASFRGSYESRTDAGRTAFGSATKYLFQGGRRPECRRATCVAYIINSRDAGFLVLAGGGNLVAALAQTVAESVLPRNDQDE